MTLTPTEIRTLTDKARTQMLDGYSTERSGSFPDAVVVASC
jgi:hypothetical protein